MRRAWLCVCVCSCICICMYKRVYLRRNTAGRTTRQSFMLLWLLIRLIRLIRPLASMSVRTHTHQCTFAFVYKYKRRHELTKRVFVNKMSVYGWKSFMRATPIRVCTHTNTYIHTQYTPSYSLYMYVYLFIYKHAHRFLLTFTSIFRFVVLHSMISFLVSQQQNKQQQQQQNNKLESTKMDNKLKIT